MFWSDCKENGHVNGTLFVKRCFIPLNSKKENLCDHGEQKFCLTRLDAHLPRFQGARPGHMRVESSSCLFPKGVCEFYSPKGVRPRSDPGHGH